MKAHIITATISARVNSVAELMLYLEQLAFSAGEPWKIQRALLHRQYIEKLKTKDLVPSKFWNITSKIPNRSKPAVPSIINSPCQMRLNALPLTPC